MAKAPVCQEFYCPRLKPGVKFGARKKALAINIKTVIINKRNSLILIYFF